MQSSHKASFALEFLTKEQIQAFHAMINGVVSHWLCFTEACAISGASARTVCSWKDSGKIRTHRVGRTTYYNREDCEAYRKRREQRKANVTRTTLTDR